MQPLDPPKFIKIYYCVKRSGNMYVPVGPGNCGYGCGHYDTHMAAEQARIMDTLCNTQKSWVYELDVPNPLLD